MTPLALFAYVVMAGLGLFVCWLFTLLGGVLYIALKGWMIELAKSEDDRKAPKTKGRKFDTFRFILTWSSLIFGTCILLYLGSRL